MDYGNQYDNNWKPQTSRDQYKRSDLYTEDLYYTTAVTTLMKFKYTRKQIMGAVEHYVCMKGNTDFNAEDILRMLQERQISKDSIEVDCPTSEKSTVKDSEVDTIREENKKIVDSKLCKICLVKNVNVVFLPCGHICACSDCSPYIKNCAICRTYIQNVVNIKVL